MRLRRRRFINGEGLECTDNCERTRGGEGGGDDGTSCCGSLIVITPTDGGGLDDRSLMDIGPVAIYHASLVE